MPNSFVEKVLAKQLKSMEFSKKLKNIYFKSILTRNSKEPFSKAAAEVMPVDVYIGGKEHATLHLYYARFFTRFRIKKFEHFKLF
jgi:leucyl-tRNA synthetase